MNFRPIIQLLASRLGTRPACCQIRCFGGVSSVNSFTERTHNCGQIRLKDVGKRVNLFGWVQYTRFNNKIIALRDSYGVVQCVVEEKQVKEWRKRDINNESVLQISGVVRERPEGQSNESLPTGSIEVLADKLEILSLAKKDLSILTRDAHNTQHNNRYKYRYLDLRSPAMQHALRFRSKVCRLLRQKLYDLNFVECETPTLYNRTPGGATEFIVPTQEPNRFYSLVQSPQQLKQLLMIGGLDRYFQICRCYRDESSRADRQPEFTQLDIELSFTNQNLVMHLIDSLVFYLLSNLSDDSETAQVLTSSFDDDFHIKRVTYQDSMEKYGTDKPDTRFGWLIENQEDFLSIEVPFTIDRETMFIIVEAAKESLSLEHGAPDVSFEEVRHQDKSLTRIKTSQRSEKARKLLGAIRNAVAKELVDRGENIYNSELEFLWVIEFPLFTFDDQGKLEPNHHPFTAPTEDSVHLLEQNPILVKGQHYDLVLNGQEIAGGSIRIHDAALQRRIFSDFLKIDQDHFRYFIEALSSGCPPHGGIAFGLDRLVSILLKRKSIRDVIAFPKTLSGRDLVSNCPEDLSADVKLLYHLNPCSTLKA